jgi:hypothetical protein
MARIFSTGSRTLPTDDHPEIRKPSVSQPGDDAERSNGEDFLYRVKGSLRSPAAWPAPGGQRAGHAAWGPVPAHAARLSGGGRGSGQDPCERPLDVARSVTRHL